MACRYVRELDELSTRAKLGAVAPVAGLAASVGDRNDLDHAVTEFEENR